jgi:exopolysaccharide biosynthesis polyprenyl glycosylphosphotransferase
MIFFLSPRYALPRLFIFYYAVISYLLIAMRHLALSFLIRWAPMRRQVLIVGTGWPAQTIIEALKRYAPQDYDIAGCINEYPANGNDKNTFVSDIIGDAGEISGIVQKYNVKEIVLATTENIDGALFQAIMDCYELGISITPMPILYEQLTGMVPVEYVRGHWNVVLPLEGQSPFNPNIILKRSIDIILSLAGLGFFILFLPLLALIIKIDSRGLVFYRQERVGKAGRLFNILKLRTMVPNAEPDYEAVWATDNDSRVTRFGRFLRKSRIDEAPQLINVLKGDMSLVGPRPERKFFVERLQQTIPFYRTRLTLRPGITGWAQVNYGYGCDEKDALQKLKYDLYYIRHCSLFLDMMILFRTIGQVVRLVGS